jgi:hypothetical protein
MGFRVWGDISGGSIDNCPPAEWNSYGKGMEKNEKIVDITSGYPKLLTYCFE